MSKQRLDDWEPNAVLVPTWIIEDYLLYGTINDEQFRYLLNCIYPVRNTGEAVEEIFPDKFDPAPAPVPIESDSWSWFNIELKQRFPDEDEVPHASVEAVFTAAGNNRQWITDMLDITLDYNNTKSSVSKPVGFILSALRRGTPEQSRQQAQEISKYRETTGNSVVDQALSVAKSRITEPTPEPRTSKLRQLTAKEKEKGENDSL